MGRSKFPGKPSKLVHRKRISVLKSEENNKSNSSSDEGENHHHRNRRNDDDDGHSGGGGVGGNGSTGAGGMSADGKEDENERITLRNGGKTGNGTSKFCGGSGGANGSTSTTITLDDDDGEFFQSTSVSQDREKPPSSEPPDGGGKQKSQNGGGVTTRARNTNVPAAATAATNNASQHSTSSSSSSSLIPATNSNSTIANNPANKKETKTTTAGGEKPPKKKTVTFKNVLETSDDASAVKKVYNPDPKTPLVPIIKKECLSRSVRLARTDCIVRPSRLTEILKNNANNIDKLNFLKFRTTAAAGSAAESNAVSADASGEQAKSESATPLAADHVESAAAGADSEKIVVVGDKRFVLPKRSAHSCRVIKPNKRFLDDTELFTKTVTHRKPLTKKINFAEDGVGAKDSGGAPKDGQLTAPKHDVFARSAPVTTSTTTLKNVRKSKLTTDCGADEVEECLEDDDEESTDEDDLSETSHVATDESQSDTTEEEEDDMENKSTYRSNPFEKCNKSLFSTMTSSSSSLSSTTANKVILRQPRLQFDNSTHMGLFEQSITTAPTLSSSPFTLNLNSTIAMTSQTTNLLTSNSCGVCCTIISCKTLQQSRKYGIFACEACRKFISKITKKSVASANVPNTASTLLQCSKGDGTCSIYPLPKANTIKNFKRTYKERCSACWLKKCLKIFNFPSGHRQRLIAILPSSHLKDLNNKTPSGASSSSIINPTSFSIINKKDSLATITSGSEKTTNLFVNPPSKLINWNATCGSVDGLFESGCLETSKTITLPNPLAENNATFGSTPLLKPTLLEKPVFRLLTPTTTVVSSGENEIECIAEPEPEPSNETNKIKLRRKEKESANSPVTTTTPVQSTLTTAAAATNNSVEPPKRQRIDLKGPRVKHVCRSASIVLGQPIATFASDSSALDSMDTPPRPESPNNAEVELSEEMLQENCRTCTTNHDEHRTDLGLSPPATPTENPNNTEECCTIADDSKDEGFSSMIVVEKEIKSNPKKPIVTTTVPRNLNSFSKKFIKESLETPSRKPKAPIMISIDFWENYDPAEVSQTGFGLIVTESIPQKALCFLCGSTGLDPLIFCACCCEPYHQYCVQDEYNLKHSSLDETMISLLDTSVNRLENINLITNRLNWLCPRCTVCYTCNMSSGSKVKCQKCQKNYHSTCLGTSKRLFGADRPLICVNCLKCKSCSTTKVSKFVGNLPMCSQCFKLRKKGNFCPICQKCYEDNDFDLKMMECGDCQRWVHSKCEGLSDEQYNLLSTLPESIEFICKKCSRTSEHAKERAQEWREAVAMEFKSGLLSVVKLLSKSRQACALLKLSPRKKSKTSCVCQPPSNAARSLKFSKLDSRDSSEMESQSSDDVYEFKDFGVVPPSTPNQVQIPPKKCYCSAAGQTTESTQPSLVDVKLKINANDYVSLAEFNYDMNNVILGADCDELIIAYKEILSEQFPWFQNETKACTDALEDDMFDSCGYSQNADDIERDQQVPVIDLPEDIEDCLYSANCQKDSRFCMFCKKTGECDSAHESRLLYCGHNSWVHTNCAMWSAEVFEEIDGSLQNVHSAISRGRMIKCTVCNNRGATIGCNVKSCGEHYHFTCARSINCAFMTDKTVYCPEHASEAGKKKCSIERNFDVLRPVYVELDRKKKKLIEPTKVQFVIGSLEVKNLGRINSKFSDTNEAIVPIDFLCTRLFWSIKEPWKVVEYTVRTVIESNIITLSHDTGRNFTVDHTTNSNIVQLGLAQITRWHNSLLMGEDIDFMSYYHRPGNSFKHILEAVGGGQGNNTSDDGNEEEPQNNADLLPPEIKDAIFEDLPHDILDGISMLDIFPKLMIFEDMIAIDSKTEGYILNEHSKDNAVGISDDDAGGGGNSSQHRSIDLELSNGWPTNSIGGHVEDAMLSAVRPLGASREIKRSKSEVFPRIGGCRSQQRSSSLTWSCKLENNSVKRRKITKGLQDLFSLGQRKYDFPSRRLSQHEDSKTKTFTWSAAKRYTTEGDEKLKVPQLDGMDDTTEYQQNIYTADGPVKCDRCHCTYRTHDSFQRHLANCEAFSTSESESETARSPDVQSPPMQNIIIDVNKAHHHQQQQPISFIQNLNNGIPIANLQNNIYGSLNGSGLQNVGLPIAQFNQGLQNIFINGNAQGQQQQQAQQQFYPTIQNFTNGGTHPAFTSAAQTLSFTSNGGIQSHQQQPQIFTMASADGNQQILTFAPQMQQPLQHIRAATNQIYQQQAEPTKGRGTAKLNKVQSSPKGKQKQPATIRPIQLKQKKLQPTLQQQPQQHQQQPQAIQILNQNVLQQQQQPQSIILQQNGNSSQPIIIQPSGGAGGGHQNLISYVTTDGSNNMQYVTLPTQGDYKSAQASTYLTAANPLVQGAYLQADASGNLVFANAQGGLQMLSSAPLQLAQSAQPQVIGTLIQPQALQLSGGVMSADQMMLGTAPTLEMMTNPMILSSQPVYYGLETIVQNTVMSSQQFVSTAMQGVLSQNASFSATTTQVFQASKIEPMVEVPTTGYVVLNDGTTAIVQQQPNSQGNIISANVIQQQPTMAQLQPQHIQSNQQNIQAQQQQQQQQQPIYNIQPQQLIHQNQIQQKSHQQKHTMANHKASTQAQVREVSPAKPTAKSSPIVVTKIQPQIVNKVVPTSQQTHNIEQKLFNPAKAAAAAATTITITPSEITQPQEIIIPTSSSSAAASITPIGNGPKIPNLSPQAIKPKSSPSHHSGIGPALPIQRKTNMIRPLNKVSSITIKPKIANKINNNVKSTKNTTTTPVYNSMTVSSTMVPMAQPQLPVLQNGHVSEPMDISPIPKSNNLNQIEITNKSLCDQFDFNTTEYTITSCDQNSDFLTLRQAHTSDDNHRSSRPMPPVTSSVSIELIHDHPQNHHPPINQPQPPDMPPLFMQTNNNNQQPQQYMISVTTSPKQPQLQQNSTVTTSSIQLPSAPFVVPPFGQNTNVPTNIVNPIQQNQSSPIVSRPTNRVLPMQSIQPKQKTNATIKPLQRKQPTLVESKTYAPVLSPEFTMHEKDTADMNSRERAEIEEQIDSILRNEEVVVQMQKEVEDAAETEAFNNNFNNVDETDGFDLKTDPQDDIPDSDDMSDAATPEVKEKICEILENLENDEKASPRLADSIRDMAVHQHQQQHQQQQQQQPELKSEHVENMLIDQKENVDPVAESSSTAVQSIFKTSTLRSEYENRQETQPSGPRLLYEIQSEDGFTYKSTSITEIWEKVFEAVQVARKAHGLLPLPEGPLADMSGVQMLGLKTNAVRYLIEQLPGVERCSKYTPKYHKRLPQTGVSSSGYSSDQEDLKENSYGVARCEPYPGRSEYDMFSWLASRHRKQPIQVFVQPSDNEIIPRRGTGSNLPMAMKYRTLKETYKDYVGVFRSHIHGRGLYCTKDIEAGEMVIEYAGELIRSTLTDKRERYYDGKGIGCYMFKIDDNLVVDATMRGNAARFINHACEPNCYSKVVDILGHKHIIIFALRRIVQGEELTYDYKFPFEDDKIPCSCGSKKCRKYLN